MFIYSFFSDLSAALVVEGVKFLVFTLRLPKTQFKELFILDMTMSYSNLIFVDDDLPLIKFPLPCHSHHISYYVIFDFFFSFGYFSPRRGYRRVLKF